MKISPSTGRSEMGSLGFLARDLLRKPAGWSGGAFAAFVLTWMFVAVWRVSDKTVSFEENRTLEAFPEISRVLEPGYDFGSRFERWFADHFWRRKAMVRLSNKLRLRGNSFILHGKDGWLYGVLYDGVEVYTHANRFDDGQIETLRSRTAEFGRRAKAAGVGHVYFVFSNDKESLCPEFYPSGHGKVHPESRFDQLWNALQGASPDVALLRFTDRLMEAKSHTEVFCRCGTHMNDLSSFLVYGWLIDRIREDYPSLAKVVPADCRFGRDASHTDTDLLKLGGVPFYPDRFLLGDFAELRAPKAKVMMKEKRLDEFERVVQRTRNDSVENDLRLYLLTDSFGRRWIPYLAESAKETLDVFIGGSYPFSLSEREARELLEMKPDILIVNFTERFLQRLLALEFPEEVR